MDLYNSNVFVCEDITLLHSSLIFSSIFFEMLISLLHFFIPSASILLRLSTIYLLTLSFLHCTTGGHTCDG